MRQIEIHADEWYPVYDMSDHEADNMSVGYYEVSDAEYAELSELKRLSDEHFERFQERLEKLGNEREVICPWKKNDVA